jgi:hypothetical protein
MLYSVVLASKRLSGSRRVIEVIALKPQYHFSASQFLEQPYFLIAKYVMHDPVDYVPHVSATYHGNINFIFRFLPQFQFASQFASVKNALRTDAKWLAYRKVLLERLANTIF